MDIIEAKVEAAMYSRLALKKVYIVKHNDSYLLSVNTVEEFETWYENGCEKGVGFREQAKKEVVEKRKSKTAAQLIDGIEVKVRKPKVELDTKTAKSVKMQDAVRMTETSVVKIDGKIWVVSVRGNWAIQESLMSLCEGGLILIIRDKGHYVYPKSMWNEFDGIFKSGTYTSGKPYSQSVLPKKFSKYFKQQTQ